MEFKHISVLLNETIDSLKINPAGLYMDATVGAGGHSYEIAKRLTTGKLVCIDQDEDALKTAKANLKEFGENVIFVKGNFREMKKLMMPLALFGFDGILMDIGVSSYQLDNPERGFTFKENTRLDMRMDKSNELTAEKILNDYEEKDLYKIFKEYGEERFSGRIAQNIVKAREKKRITTTYELNKIIENSVLDKQDMKVKSIMRIYQALRIEVNDELNALKFAIEDAMFLLKKGGRLAVISFHSLEDRIVKNAFKYLESDCICDIKQAICTCDKVKTGNIITKKPIMATDEEIKNNNRAHSAKLRVIEKV
ncbi:MAG: 16S rRNA (cytosine(1402)-N(4))-methyltransferase RsmH [Ezakiella sp.]|nr:16S rRNA (cytosine(1402)-N(4))-methyltransferase RsmH [Ezakiella sp.]MDD7472064.1 16S rRNA (cytosine(1402)-N(4))-methyltransferase RsmH [Bacillota bacterium]MDY3924028.1 16S rRNA (cytosine(1402)-N(4))-methyltransferase RsmH [Ezakiella sp.]